MYVPITIKRKECDENTLRGASESRFIITLDSIDADDFTSEEAVSSLFTNSDPEFCPDVTYGLLDNDAKKMYEMMPEEDHTIRVLEDKVFFNLKNYDSKGIHFFVTAQTIEGSPVLRAVSILPPGTKCITPSLSLDDE